MSMALDTVFVMHESGGSDELVRVLSLSTPNPRRVHLMDEDGYVLCGVKHLRFCLETAHRGYHCFIPTCTPCAMALHHMLDWTRR